MRTRAPGTERLLVLQGSATYLAMALKLSDRIVSKKEFIAGIKTLHETWAADADRGVGRDEGGLLLDKKAVTNLVNSVFAACMLESSVAACCDYLLAQRKFISTSDGGSSTSGVGTKVAQEKRASAVGSTGEIHTQLWAGYCAPLPEVEHEVAESEGGALPRELILVDIGSGELKYFHVRLPGSAEESVPATDSTSAGEDTFDEDTLSGEQQRHHEQDEALLEAKELKKPSPDEFIDAFRAAAKGAEENVKATDLDKRLHTVLAILLKHVPDEYQSLPVVALGTQKMRDIRDKVGPVYFDETCTKLRKHAIKRRSGAAVSLRVLDIDKEAFFEHAAVKFALTRGDGMRNVVDVGDGLRSQSNGAAGGAGAEPAVATPPVRFTWIGNLAWGNGSCQGMLCGPAGAHEDDHFQHALEHYEEMVLQKQKEVEAQATAHAAAMHLASGRTSSKSKSKSKSSHHPNMLHRPSKTLPASGMLSLLNEQHVDQADPFHPFHPITTDQFVHIPMGLKSTKVNVVCVQCLLMIACFCLAARLVPSFTHTRCVATFFFFFFFFFLSGIPCRLLRRGQPWCSRLPSRPGHKQPFIPNRKRPGAVRGRAQTQVLPHCESRARGAVGAGTVGDERIAPAAVCFAGARDDAPTCRAGWRRHERHRGCVNGKWQHLGHIAEPCRTIARAAVITSDGRHSGAEPTEGAGTAGGTSAPRQYQHCAQRHALCFGRGTGTGIRVDGWQSHTQFCH